MANGPQDVSERPSACVPVNAYRRTSLGLGYILSDYVHLKLEYTLNDTSGGDSEPSLNQFSTGIAAKF